MIQYNESIVRKYRELAITDLVDFVPGNVYYSNHFGGFELVGLQTRREHYKWVGLDVYGSAEEMDKPSWFLHKPLGSGEKYTDVCCVSLCDNNIGDSYNPWLIFNDEETMERYKEELVITNERSIWYRDDNFY